MRKSLTEEIKATARGAAIIKDWLGAGGVPVPECQAIRRAAICSQCDHNQHGNWWENIKSAIANAIRETLAIKRLMKLQTEFDGSLGTCDVCRCNNPLQVWVPIDHVKGHTPPEMVEKFPDFCWKKRELTIKP